MMNTEIVKLPTAGLVVLKDQKLLLAFSGNKKAWYLPGGKIDAGETSVEAIIREIKEELNLELNREKLVLYRHITAPAYGEHSHIQMEQDCFFYDLTENIVPSNEIDEVAYFDLQTYLQEPAQVPGVLMLFKSLEKDGLIATHI